MVCARREVGWQSSGSQLSLELPSSNAHRPLVLPYGYAACTSTVWPPAGLCGASTPSTSGAWSSERCGGWVVGWVGGCGGWVEPGSWSCSGEGRLELVLKSWGQCCTAAVVSHCAETLLWRVRSIIDPHCNPPFDPRHCACVAGACQPGACQGSGGTVRGAPAGRRRRLQRQHRPPAQPIPGGKDHPSPRGRRPQLPPRPAAVGAALAMWPAVAKMTAAGGRPAALAAQWRERHHTTHGQFSVSEHFLGFRFLLTLTCNMSRQPWTLVFTKQWRRPPVVGARLVSRRFG